VVAGMELMCSQVATLHRLLKETLTVVGRDVLQLARVSPQMEKSFLNLVFPVLLLLDAFSSSDSSCNA
jgi:hypothetical protein